MCVGRRTNSRTCGVCIKLRSLLKVHYRLHHRAHSETLCSKLQIKPTKICFRQTTKVDKQCQTEDEERLYNNHDIKIERVDTFSAINVVPQETTQIEDTDDYEQNTGSQISDESEVVQKHPLNVISEVKPSKTKKTIHVSIAKASRKASKEKTPHACTVCGKTFKLLKTLRRHYAREHDSDDDHSDNELNSPESPTEIFVPEPVNERHFQCKICNKTYTQKKNFRKHCKSAHKNVDFTAVPDDTDITESQDTENVETKVKTRKKRTPKAEKHEYSCRFCEEVFTKASVLQKHLRKHTKEKPYLCETCGAAYASPGALRTHKKTHSGEDLYPCDVCNKIFATKTRLLVHARVHSGEKPFSCEYCGRGFSNISGLKPHLRLHTGEKPFKCHLCDYASTVKAGLKQHMVNHGEMTIYSCHLCDKKFRFKAKYKAHIIMHSGERRHFCNICNRGFFYANEVKKHMNTVHSQARPFKCTFCDQAYKRKTHVTRHMQSAHRVELQGQKSHETQDSKPSAQMTSHGDDITLRCTVVALGNPNPDLRSPVVETTSCDPPVMMVGNPGYDISNEAKYPSTESRSGQDGTANNQPVAETNQAVQVGNQQLMPQDLTQHRHHRQEYPNPHKEETTSHKIEEGEGYQGPTVSADWYAAALASAVHYSQQMGM